MSRTQVEVFDTREERDERAKQLSSTHSVHKTTNQVLSGKKDKKGRTLGKMVYEVRWSVRP